MQLRKTIIGINAIMLGQELLFSSRVLGISMYHYIMPQFMFMLCIERIWRVFVDKFPGFSTGFFTVSTPGFSKFTPGFPEVFLRVFSWAGDLLFFKSKIFNTQLVVLF
jgi:hypothetical protein